MRRGGPCRGGARDDGTAELSEQFGNGDGDQFQGGGAAVADALPGGSDGQEGRGEQADRGPAVPVGPRGDLSAVQAGDLLGHHAAFDELFLDKLHSMENLPWKEVLDQLNSGLSDFVKNWAQLSPLAVVLLAKLRCSYEDGVYLDRLKSESNVMLKSESAWARQPWQ
jgi:hypothetical protein